MVVGRLYGLCGFHFFVVFFWHEIEMKFLFFTSNLFAFLRTARPSNPIRHNYDFVRNEHQSAAKLPPNEFLPQNTEKKMAIKRECVPWVVEVVIVFDSFKYVFDVPHRNCLLTNERNCRATVCNKKNAGKLILNCKKNHKFRLPLIM